MFGRLCRWKTWPFQVLNWWCFFSMHLLSANWHRLCFAFAFSTQWIKYSDVFKKRRKKRARCFFSFYCQEFTDKNRWNAFAGGFLRCSCRNSTCFYWLKYFMQTNQIVAIECATRKMYVAIKLVWFFLSLCVCVSLSLPAHYILALNGITCTSKNVKCGRYISKIKAKLKFMSCIPKASWIHMYTNLNSSFD